MELAATIMKILVLNLLLAFAVHADNAPPPDSSPSPSPPPFTDDSPVLSPSDDSPPPLPAEIPPPSPPALPPPAPPVPVFPPPSPLSCKEQCFLECADKKGLRRIICVGKCLTMCIFLPSDDGAGYHCTQHCIMNNLLRHQPDMKSIDGLVDSCHNNCTKQV